LISWKILCIFLANFFQIFAGIIACVISKKIEKNLAKIDKILAETSIT